MNIYLVTISAEELAITVPSHFKRHFLDPISEDFGQAWLQAETTGDCPNMS